MGKFDDQKELLGYTLRGLGWRIMLNVYGTQSSRWPDDMKANIDGYEMWRTELIKDLSSMKEIYKNHGIFSELKPEEIDQIYEHDFKIAHKYHKHMRL